MNGIASTLLGSLQSFLSYFQSERHFNDNRKDEALLAIQKALLESKKYIELSKGEVDREKEYEIAELWAQASVKARHVSEELGFLLKGKSQFWSDSFEWSYEEVQNKGIDFASIEKQLDELLRNS